MLNKSWLSLVDAIGGNGPACRLLGISPSTLQRLKAGQVAIPQASEAALAATCAIYGLPVPDPPRASLTDLSQAGEGLKRGVVPDVERLQRKYPTWQLTELAESDETPEEILRAVTYLLEAE